MGFFKELSQKLKIYSPKYEDARQDFAGLISFGDWVNTHGGLERAIGKVLELSLCFSFPLCYPVEKIGGMPDYFDELTRTEARFNYDARWSPERARRDLGVVNTEWA